MIKWFQQSKKALQIKPLKSAGLGMSGSIESLLNRCEERVLIFDKERTYRTDIKGFKTGEIKNG